MSVASRLKDERTLDSESKTKFNIFVDSHNIADQTSEDRFSYSKMKETKLANSHVKKDSLPLMTAHQRHALSSSVFEETMSSIRTLTNRAKVLED